MNGKKLILPGIIIIGFFLRIVSLDRGLGFADETLYHEAGLRIYQNPFYILTLTVIHTHPPLHWIYSLTAVPGIIYMRYASAIIGTFCIMVLYYCVKKHIGEQEALISAGLFAITGYYVLLSRIAYPSILIILFFIILIFQFINFIKNPTLKNSILYGVMLTLTILLKEPAVLFIPATLLYLIWDRQFKILKNKNYWIGMLFPFLILTPIILYAFYYILPNYITGLTITELPSFYQLYMNRGLNPLNILYGMDYIFAVFNKFSSLPMLIIFSIGIWYALVKGDSLNKLFLSIMVIYLLFFSMMYNKPVEGFLDWHLKFIFLPMLLLSGRAMKNLLENIKNKNVWIICFIVGIMFLDLIIINTMNQFMIDNYSVLPLIQTDSRVDIIAGIFNATRN